MSNAGFEIGRASLDRLRVTADPQVDAEILAEVFAGDIRQWPEEQWLVIDDYQEITGAGAPERFIENLLHTCPISLLLLTRERPSWASARRILYGEIAELDRDALAMNDDETRQLLIRDEDGAAALFEASRGWPAAIALAAISSPRSHGVKIASDLHRFFAEELYQGLDDSTRRGLWAISLVAPERADALTLMLDVQSAAVTLAVGHQQGFLTTAGRDVVEVHPLLRDFLEDKLRQEQPHSAEPLLTAAFEYLMKRRLWDKAFDLIHRFEWFHLISDLIREALQDLLSQGRTETLKRWVARSGPAAAEFAVGLASAELAFREGHYYASEILAKAAADSARTKDPDIELRALIAAGRAAHAASREREALSLYKRAKSIETEPELERVAAMGELVAAIELELPEALDLAQILTNCDDLRPQERVVLAGRVLNLQACYALPVDLDAGRAARQLLHLVDDPVARCSFRNVFGYALAACGQYQEALDLTDDQLRDVERCGSTSLCRTPTVFRLSVMLELDTSRPPRNSSGRPASFRFVPEIERHSQSLGVFRCAYSLRRVPSTSPSPSLRRPAV